MCSSDLITSGTLAAARVPLATTTTAGGVIVPTSGGLSVDGSGNISAAFATTTQAQDLISTAVAMSPDNVRRAITAWRQAPYTTSFTANGAATTSQLSQAALNTSSTLANSSASLYWNSQTMSASNDAGSPNWARPIAMFARVYRQACPANGVFRYLFGLLSNSGFAYETLNNRGIGFEIRQARIWVIAHNGTSLTQFDTGIDSVTTDYSGSGTDVFLRSDGSGNVTINVSVAGAAVQSATTTGGPTTQGNSAQRATVYAALTNGASASQAWFFFTPHVLYLP